MKRARDIERMVQDLRHPVDAEAHDRVVGHLLDALKRHQTPAAARQPHTGRMIMKSPMAKLAVATAIIAAVVLGLFEFITTDAGPGVVWAEVARKVQASGSLVLRIRETGSLSPGESDYAIKYFSPAGARTDVYKDGQVTRSQCYNAETKTTTSIHHGDKRYYSYQPGEGIEGFLEKDEDWTNPRYLVQQILSVEHTELGEKTVDGILCEGLETSDPAVVGNVVDMVDSLDVYLELWVDVQTQYPVRFESRVVAEAEGEVLESECIMDQFQWDVEIDPSRFKLEIPDDYYKQM